MLSDIVWPAVLLYCEINDNQILLNIECSELKNLVDIVMIKSNLHEVLGLVVTTRTVSYLNFLFFFLSAMAASSSQPETMKAECSLDNPKVYSFFLILFIISCILFLLHYIQCHFMAFEEDFTITW